MTSPNPTSAELFRRLHANGLLLLANAWDAGTARLIESLGAKALATTSAGLAWSHGYPDGDRLPVPVLAATVAEIARVTHVPLTVDLEGGYSNDPSAVGETVAAVIAAGAVGINIEDGADTPDLLSAKIEAAKNAGVRLGIDLFVNARTDVYLRDLAPREDRIKETLSRAERYRAAGADGIFVPRLTDSAEIKEIVAGVALPLNVLAWAGLPTASKLSHLGVRRLSAGSGIAQFAFGRISTLAATFLRDGTHGQSSEDLIPYPEMNALLEVR